MLVGIVGAGLWVGPTLRDLYRGGFFNSVGTRQYKGTLDENLKAIRTALMLYHDSEGQFPNSAGWMDAIRTRIRTDDLSGAEAEKKLMDPAYGGKPNVYGFAMNDAASGKYKDDIKDKKAPLIFESQSTARNAHGDPKKDAPNPPHRGGDYGITVDGVIVKLSN